MLSFTTATLLLSATVARVSTREHSLRALGLISILVAHESLCSFVHLQAAFLIDGPPQLVQCEPATYNWTGSFAFPVNLNRQLSTHLGPLPSPAPSLTPLLLSPLD